MKKKIKALGATVIIKQIDQKRRKSGLIIPKSQGSSVEQFRGYVLAIGPDCRYVKKGDLVTFGSHSFAIVHHGGQEYFYAYERALPAIEAAVSDDYEAKNDDEFLAEFSEDEI